MPDKPWKRRERESSRQIGAERNIGSGSMVQADQAVIRTLGEIERTEALARGENPSQAMMFGG